MPFPLILRDLEVTVSVSTGGARGLSLSCMVITGWKHSSLPVLHNHVSVREHTCTHGNTNAHTSSLAQWTLHMWTQAHMNTCACLNVCACVHTCEQVYTCEDIRTHEQVCTHSHKTNSHRTSIRVTGFTEDEGQKYGGGVHTEGLKQPLTAHEALQLTVPSALIWPTPTQTLPSLTVPDISLLLPLSTSTSSCLWQSSSHIGFHEPP